MNRTGSMSFQALLRSFAAPHSISQVFRGGDRPPPAIRDKPSSSPMALDLFPALPYPSVAEEPNPLLYKLFLMGASRRGQSSASGIHH